tara:strand:+ start:48 stop:1619 length:1572 start_codon:yes stop_codon:yes gene_type:complete
MATKTKITTYDIENHLEGLGKQDSKGKVHFERVLFNIKTLKSGVKIVLDSPDHETLLKNFKSRMIQSLMGEFKGGVLVKVEEKVKGINKGIDNPVIRLRYVDQGTKHIDFDVKEYPTKKDHKSGGTLNAKISEPATRLIFNAALESKGKIFKTEEDIFVEDVYKDLEKLFGKQWGHKLDSWIYTFLMQNKLFFENYGKTTWAKFKHKDYKGERDMQVFFGEHLKTLEQSPGIKVGRNYEQWNPADIWAVKRTEQSTLEDEITEATKNPSADNLMKLNTHIITLMEKKELVGISLKKIESGGSFKIFNVDSSKLLTNLKAWKALDKFEMNDIRFEIRNVFGNFPGKGGGIAATNYIYYGSKFQVSVTRTTTGSLVFNTLILNEKGAQGGQSPIQPLLKALKHKSSGVTFNNKIKDYPATANDFADIMEQPSSSEYKKYNNWFNLAYNHSKNDYNTIMKFDDWANNVYLAYESRPKEGIAKLALLNFWHDALKYHDNDPEFWTDMLYFGMKITMKGNFGPHVKIS